MTPPAPAPRHAPPDSEPEAEALRRELARQVLTATYAFLRELGLDPATLAQVQRYALTAPLDAAVDADGRVGVEHLSTHLDAVQRLLVRWRTGDRYVDDDGQPRPLSRHGDLSLDTLATEAGIGHLDPVLELAQALGTFVVESGTYRPAGDEILVLANRPERWLVMATAGRHLLETLAFNARAAGRGRPTRFQSYAHQARLDRRYLPLFQPFLREQGEMFLRALDTWLEQHRAQTPGVAETEVTVHTFFWSDDPGRDP